MTLAIPAPAATVDELERSLAGPEPWSVRLGTLADLAERDFAGKRRLFTALLENESEPTPLRGAAARWLGRSGGSDTLARLLGDERLRDRAVLAHVVTALGRSGGREALDGLRTVAASGTDRTARLARFAAALVCHRHGIEGADLPPAGELWPPPTDGRPIELRRASAEETAAGLRALAREPLGIEYARDGAYHLRCGKSDRLVLLNRELAGRGATARLGERKALVGVVADRQTERGEHSTFLLILSSPTRTPGRVVLQLCRPTGEALLAGSAVIDGAAARFEARSVARPGGQLIRINGTLAGGELALTTAIAGRLGQPRRTPTPDTRRR